MLGNAVLGLCPKLAKIIGKQLEKLFLDRFTNGIPMLCYLRERQRRNIQFDLAVCTALQDTKLFKFGNQLVKKLVVGLYIARQEGSVKTQYALQRASVFEQIICPMRLTEKRLTIEHLAIKLTVIV